MARRGYHLGRRQPSVDRTRASILAAARGLLGSRPVHDVSIAEIARQAAVSRITVYNRFGSRAGLLDALARPAPPGPLAEAQLEPREALHRRLAEACARWSQDPGLHRNLPPSPDAGEPERDRSLVERLASTDQLRPGCSIKEAEDVIGVLTSFAVFDRLYRDGRRSTAAVADILMRLASTILVG
jgi:AcrR family transcriptional regulator